jgi:hypothetical protein
VLIVCIAAIDWGMGGSTSFSARRSRCSVTAGFSKLLFFLLLGFFPALFGAPPNVISNILGPCLDLLYHSKNSLKVPHTIATARICSHILVELFMQERSHFKEPPFPGVTIWMLLECTMNDPSVAPGLGITFAGEFSSFFALSNIASKIAIGIVVIPHSAADKGSWFADEDAA